MRLSLLLLMVGFFATPAEAYPEFVRHGYFSCTSCHVSPGGGGALTEYGRGFEAEKLATFVRKDEELPLHGLVGPTPPWLVVGGNMRQIQTVTESARSRDGRYIPMQRDLEACVHPGPVFVCATEDFQDKRTRRASVRGDIGENFTLRAGRFLPRYGLMIANHTSAIRQGLGFDQDAETDQVEATFLSERVEVTAAKGFGRKRGDLPKAETGSAFFSASEKTRLGASYHRAKETRTIGVNVATALGDQWFLLAEVDEQIVPHKRAAVSFLRLGYELARGFFPYVTHEVTFKNVEYGATRRDLYGYGLQWFPRPHFELDTLFGHALSRETMSYASAAYLLLHYHL